SPVTASRGAMGVCTLSIALWGGASRNVSEALGTGVALPPSRAGGDCPVRPPATCPPDVATAGSPRTAGTGCPAEAALRLPSTVTMFSGLGATALSRPVLRRGGLTAGLCMPTSPGGAWFVLGSHPRAPDTLSFTVLGPWETGTGSGSIHLSTVVETVTSMGLGVAEGGATCGTPLPVVLG